MRLASHEFFNFFGVSCAKLLVKGDLVAMQMGLVGFLARRRRA